MGMAARTAGPNAEELSWRNAKLNPFLTLQTSSESKGSSSFKVCYKLVPCSSSLSQKLEHFPLLAPVLMLCPAKA